LRGFWDLIRDILEIINARYLRLKLRLFIIYYSFGFFGIYYGGRDGLEAWGWILSLISWQ
jgi:hypothetical protein